MPQTDGPIWTPNSWIGSHWHSRKRLSCLWFARSVVSKGRRFRGPPPLKRAWARRDASWFKEARLEAKRPTITERYRNTSLRNRFNDLLPPDAPRCDSVDLGIPRRFRAHLTQFLHSSQLHLFQYVAMFLGTLRCVHWDPPLRASFQGVYPLRPSRASRAS